jgi:hypothetical protein
LQLLSIFENGGGATKKIQLNGKKAKNVERFSKRESKFMFFKRIQITSEKNKHHSNSSHTFIIIKISNTDKNHKKQRIILQNYKITLHHAFTTTNTVTQIIIKENNKNNNSKMQRRKRNRNQYSED